MTNKKWFNLKQTIEYTGLSASTIHRHIKLGALKVSKKTGKLLFKQSWIDNWLGV